MFRCGRRSHGICYSGTLAETVVAEGGWSGSEGSKMWSHARVGLWVHPNLQGAAGVVCAGGRQGRERIAKVKCLKYRRRAESGAFISSEYAPAFEAQTMHPRTPLFLSFFVMVPQPCGLQGAPLRYECPHLMRLQIIPTACHSMRRYNLVVGAYVLSEETLPQERHRLIDQLWGRLYGTSGHSTLGHIASLSFVDVGVSLQVLE